MKKKMQVLDRIQNKIGTFVSASVAPPAGAKQATITADMDLSELHDTSDTLRIGIEADFGTGFRHMVWGTIWTGGPNQSTPSVVWQFDPVHPPQRVRGVLENITQVVAGLTLVFA